MTISEDTKAIVASNLVVAYALIYQEYSKQGREKAGTAAKEITQEGFGYFISFLDRSLAGSSLEGQKK